MKYTQTWGFHLEAEKTYTHSDDVENEKQQAKHDLDVLAQQLGITYIDDITMDKAKKAWASDKQFGGYSPEEFKKKYDYLFQIL